MPERHSKIVTLCINEDYALPCAVTVQSLLEHSAEASEWDVHLFTDKLQASTMVRLRQTIEAKGARASFHLAEYGRFKGLPLKRGFSSDAYTRLFVAHAFPEADRIIYLDSDILVQRDLAELFDLDWGSAVVAAVPNGSAPFLADFRNARRWPNDSPVFNTGLLMIHPQRWIQGEVGERVVDWLADNVEGNMFLDQDGINHILFGKIFSLDPVWNVEARLCQDYWMGLSQDWLKVRKQSKLIHFTGFRKPWSRWCDVPNRGDWFRTLKATAFADELSRPGFKPPSLYETAFGKLRFALSILRVRMRREKRGKG